MMTGLARASLAAALSALALVAVACNIVTPAVYLLDGPPKTPAAFILPDLPTVAFVDDRKNILPRFDLRGTIGDETSRVLLEKKVVQKTFSSRELLNLVRKQDTDKDLMPMDAIGRAAGADQIIYIRIVTWQLTPDGYTPRPVAGADVRVIDCVNRTRIFPTGAEESRYVEATTGEVSTELYGSNATRRKLEDLLAKQLGLEIAKLFYEHETKELGGQLRM
ncbi:MAG: hypothetical protein U0575_12910 [Phycisphaerales bacterium]